MIYIKHQQNTNTRKTPLFSLGQIVRTPGIAKFEGRLQNLLIRHQTGDWGDVSNGDKEINNSAVKNGDRILSAYSLDGEKIWIITEWDRSSTCILLPSEY